MMSFDGCSSHSPSGQGQKSVLRDAGWQEYLQWLLRRRRRFVVRENSMVPTLMPGDTILAEMGGTLNVGDIAIARVQKGQGVTPSSSAVLLVIKRVSEIFYDGGVYLISDNASEPRARDSRHFGVIEANCVIGRVTSRLATSK